MPTTIFTLHITYAPLPDLLWRDVEVSSNMRLDLPDHTLKSLGLQVGEEMEMVYDFGTEQHFLLKVTDERPMRRGEGTHYPWVTAMNGRGIVEDVPGEELLAAAEDFDRFSLETENCLLKGEMYIMECKYYEG